MNDIMEEKLEKELYWFKEKREKYKYILYLKKMDG
jgi:hypothetical protein